MATKYTDPKNDYVRPEVTKQDLISNNIEDMKEKLKDFIQIHPENYIDLDIGTWIKYVSHEGKYRTGGVLINNKAPEYLVLKNPYTKVSWCVSCDRNVLFIKDLSNKREAMIEKNNLYRLYLAGYVKILDEPDPDFFNKDK
jgi:hypothetical protein